MKSTPFRKGIYYMYPETHVFSTGYLMIHLAANNLYWNRKLTGF